MLIEDFIFYVKINRRNPKKGVLATSKTAYRFIEQCKNIGFRARLCVCTGITNNHINLKYKINYFYYYTKLLLLVVTHSVNDELHQRRKESSNQKSKEKQEDGDYNDKPWKWIHFQDPSNYHFTVQKLM